MTIETQSEATQDRAVAVLPALPPSTQNVTADTPAPPRPGDVAPVGTPAPTARPAVRLRWLDALRGIAVLAVVYEHFGGYLFPDLKDATSHFAHAGTFGVMLFFLVSGYIVPASIERRGSVRDFWIGRVFRLYPAFLLTIGLAWLFARLGRGRVPSSLLNHPETSLLSHLTMLHEVLGMGNAQPQFWTLAYEMAFYLLVTAVFVLGVHRFSAEIATLLAAAAFALGAVFPARLIAHDELSLRNLAVVAALVLFIGVIAVSGRRRVIAIAGAVLLGVFVLALLGTNQRNAPWEGFIILAVMFTGTAIFRAEQGQISWRRAATAITVVIASSAASVFVHGGVWHMSNDKPFPVEWSWLGGVLLAFVFFGVGMRARDRKVPGWLSWLGAVSYSVYLLHYVLIYAASRWLFPAQHGSVVVQVGLTAGYLAVLLVASWACYKVVELPFQRLGRRVTKGLARSR